MLYQWLLSRRLQLTVATICCYTALMGVFRLLFYFEFSGIENTAPPNRAEVLEIFYIGSKFDLRIAILMCMPLMLLSAVPKFNLFRFSALRFASQTILAVFTFSLLLFYVFDFGYYQYLGMRINAGIMRFIGDRESAAMVWQSYPVVPVSIGVMVCGAAVVYLNNRLLRHFTAKPGHVIPLSSAIFGGIISVIMLLFGLLGRFSDINLHNPIPLRWDAVYLTKNPALSATGINPVVYFSQTLAHKKTDANYDEAARYYDVVADYLSVKEKNPQTLSIDRAIGVQDNKLDFSQTPNVIFIMLESLGASRLSSYGLPFESTPNLDAVAKGGIKFLNFYVPVSGTAKTVWASTTGIPDTTTYSTATRNPMLSHQRMLINSFTEHQKLYLIGGNASWANMGALIEQSIDDVTMYKEGDWQSPVVDVWGISDLALFKESDEILRELHEQTSRPFFAMIQTAGNHRPFTIPEQRGDFQIKELDAETLRRHGFTSNAQFNGARFLDYSLGEFFKMARTSGYFDNTIFVMYGDHNNRITTTPHMAPFLQQLGLDGLHVPALIYAPKLLSPRVVEEAVSLVDLMPTMAGMLGIEYRNTTFGRDVFNPQRSGERYVFVLSDDDDFGMISNRYLLRISGQKNDAKLHDLQAAEPSEDVSAKHPERFEYLKNLTQGVYKMSQYQMYNNREH